MGNGSRGCRAAGRCAERCRCVPARGSGRCARDGCAGPAQRRVAGALRRSRTERATWRAGCRGLAHPNLCGSRGTRLGEDPRCGKCGRGCGRGLGIGLGCTLCRVRHARELRKPHPCACRRGVCCELHEPDVHARAATCVRSWSAMGGLSASDSIDLRRGCLRAIRCAPNRSRAPRRPHDPCPAPGPPLPPARPRCFVRSLCSRFAPP